MNGGGPGRAVTPTASNRIACVGKLPPTARACRRNARVARVGTWQRRPQGKVAAAAVGGLVPRPPPPLAGTLTTKARPPTALVTPSVTRPRRRRPEEGRPIHAATASARCAADVGRGGGLGATHRRPRHKLGNIPVFRSRVLTAVRRLRLSQAVLGVWLSVDETRDWPLHSAELSVTNHFCSPVPHCCKSPAGTILHQYTCSQIHLSFNPASVNQKKTSIACHLTDALSKIAT